MTETIATLETVGSGSYLPDDVHFLLRPVRMSVTDIEEKERLIQTNRRHYSEMLGREHVPGDVHKQLYALALARNGKRMATEVQALAHALDEASAGPTIVLVSLVRAGLPLGVLLRRALRDLGREVHHYGVSIVRDRGIDRVALEAIIQAHGAANIIFVDGWTGKGAISAELKRTLAGDSRFPGEPRLVVLADPCGRAWLSASAEDWLIPCGILGATVSGLVSRSIWPDGQGLHGCVTYDHLQPHDVTRAFIEHIEAERRELGKVAPAIPWTHSQRRALQAAVEPVLRVFAERHAISDPNRLKPGIAEATRAVLRRLPDQVLVRDRNDSDVQLLLHLTERAGVAVQEAGAALGPYRALTLIRSANR
ncbi:cysteine protease StiP domain-containing protein [Pseudomonas japonica]|uniref:PELOTA RNA binding domain-containing protein n=1 Tax=Pseudomonas japonica TaxID=256466 RepID=A0A239L604_9PSED|nr:cysteine protease StiP domain-containing protein [Pseudomonas japonica]SNT25253.1 PELOTA RNA binding domain-containing protein [Pseudomonas japonica]